MAQKLKPTDFGGYGRQAGPYGGLKDMEFSSRCPPDIKPQTRIIGVCGINDHNNASAPSSDGWFHSDFYLFHYLFSGTGSNQIWLTCVDPNYLVLKYTEYVHGNRLEMRRVVLDSSMLPSIQAAGNIQVTTPKVLVERFLATVRSECQIATQQNQPVLILIFGHGDSETYGVSIGGETSPDTAPRLKVADLKIAIGKVANVSILITSCYSGGWVIKSNSDSSKPILNATIMAAAGPDIASESWAKSESCGRAAGSIYASALVQAAIKMQIQDEKEDEDEDEIRSSLTYARWAKSIQDTGREEVDSFFLKHEIMFSAQNDAWDMEWKSRSGLPMTDYKGKWEMLRTIPIDISNPQTNRNPNTEFLVPLTMANLSLGESGSIHPIEGFRARYINVVREQARQYLNSFPGNDAVGGNRDHSYFQELVRGKEYDKEFLEYLSNVLCFRMSVMKRATDYKNYLGLSIDDCHLFDTWAWEQRTLRACSNQRQIIEEGLEKWRQYKDIRTTVFNSRVFDPPVAGQGLTYLKPIDYLAIALYESNRSMAQILAEVEKMVKFKKGIVTYLGQTVLENPEVQRQNNPFFRTFSRFGKKLRSLSPSKEKRKSRG